MRIRHVLIADDEIMLREVAAEALEEAGFVVHQAGDGREALSLLKTNPAIELLISDIWMPEMDGWVLAEAARTFRPDLRILLITGHALMSAPVPARFEILRKPFNLRALCERACQILDGAPDFAGLVPARAFGQGVLD